jgi:hypothetical protein
MGDRGTTSKLQGWHGNLTYSALLIPIPYLVHLHQKQQEHRSHVAQPIEAFQIVSIVHFLNLCEHHDARVLEICVALEEIATVEIQ